MSENEIRDILDLPFGSVKILFEEIEMKVNGEEYPLSPKGSMILIKLSPSLKPDDPKQKEKNLCSSYCQS